MRRTFQLFRGHASPAWAARFLDAWCKRAMHSRIEPVKKFAGTESAHRELLFNFFKAKKQFSSGVIEGLNNKAKVNLMKAYGYRTFRIAELSEYHVPGRLPQSRLAHKFF
jgi:transposase